MGVAVLFALAALDVSAQTSYRLPEAVQVPGADRLGARLLEELRPFGWSRDGKLAYLSVEEVDGRGGTIFTYRVVDAVTDRELFVFEDDSFEWPEGSGEAETPRPEHSWRRVGAEVSAALARFGIVEGSASQILRFPADLPAGTFSADVITLLEKDPEEPAFDRLDAYEVWVRRPGVASKRITAQADVFAVNATVLGYIASPFEPRLFVLVGEERYVFEGTAIAFRFFGSSLAAGFRSQAVLPGQRVSGSYSRPSGDAWLEVSQHPDGTLSLEGYAESFGPGGVDAGAVNVGEVSGTALYSQGRAVYDDGYGCRLELRFSRGRIEVTEAGSCGGLNVSFAGGYTRDP